MSEAQKYNFMKNTLKLLVISALVALLSGCGEDLKPKVAALEAELAKEKAALVATNAELAKEKSALVVANAELGKEKAALAAANAQLVMEKSALIAANAELAKEKAAFSVVSAKVALAEKLEADKKSEVASKATISISVGVTMQSGDAKPVANTKIYLTTRPLKQIFAGIKDDEGKTPRWGFTTYLAGRFGGENAVLAGQMRTAVESSSVMQEITDLTGSVVMENAPLGTYYLVCASSIGGTGTQFEKKITIKSGTVKVRLTNDDIADD